jgi:glutathione S-transferase
MSLTLHAYQYSVYAWIARLVLREKSVAHDYVEVNPFAPAVPADYLKMHPFQRVPTLVHDDFTIYETVAIAQYIDEAFPGPALQPEDVRTRARMRQIVSIVDAYGYVPMVRQVFSNRIFGPRLGRGVDESAVQSGLKEADRVLGALEDLTGADGFLTGGRISLADLHLAPMMAYLTAAPEGHALLSRRPGLLAWWETMRHRDSFIATDPGLPSRP